MEYIFSRWYKILIKEYKNLNFSNIRLVKYKDTKYYGINIDNKITVYYIHYLYADHELKRDNYLKEVKGKNIEEYIINSYNRRLARLNINEKPKFLFITNRQAHADILGKNEISEEWQEIINLLKENDYKGIVFTKFDTLKENENVKIVKITNDNPKQVLLANLDLVDNFIKEGE